MILSATIERAADGSWTAVAVIGEHTIIGHGDMKDAAIADFRSGAVALFEYLKSEGKLPEVVGVEVAA